MSKRRKIEKDLGFLSTQRTGINRTIFGARGKVGRGRKAQFENHREGPMAGGEELNPQVASSTGLG